MRKAAPRDPGHSGPVLLSVSYEAKGVTVKQLAALVLLATLSTAAHAQAPLPRNYVECTPEQLREGACGSTGGLAATRSSRPDIGTASQPGAAQHEAPPGAPPVQAPGRQDIGTFQSLCDQSHGLKTFTRQVQCIKGMITRSGDYGTQPEVVLYGLTADKLAEDVKAGRTRPADARIELQKAYMDVLAHERAVAAEKAAEEAREEAAREAAERAERAERAQEAARHAAEQQRAMERQAAIEFCVTQARERRRAYNASRGAVGQMEENAIAGGFRQDPVQKACYQNPMAYTTIPDPVRQTQLNCNGYVYSGGMAGPQVDMDCR